MTDSTTQAIRSTEELKKKVEMLQRAIINLVNSSDALSAADKELVLESTRATAAQKNLTLAVAELRTKMVDLTALQKRNAEAAKKAKAATDSMAAAEKKATTTSKAYAAAVGQSNKKLSAASAETAVLEQKIKRLERANNRLSRSQNNSSFFSKKTLSNMAAQAVVLTALYFAFTRLAQGLVALLDPGIQLEKNMKHVYGIMGLMADRSGKLSGETKKLREELTAAALAQRTGAVRASEALKFLGMAGFSARDAIAALPGVIQLARVGEMDLGRATDITTDIMTAFRMEVHELARVNDILTGTTTETNTNIEQMAQAMKFVGPVAVATGLSIERTAAMIGTLANAGIKGGIAGRSLRSALLDTGKAIGILGMEAGTNFVQVLDEINRRQLNAADIQYLFGKRASTSILILKSYGKEWRRLERELRKAGITQNIYNEKMGSMAGQLAYLKGTVEKFKIALKDAFNDDLIDVFSRTRRYIEDNTDRIILKMKHLLASGKKTWDDLADTRSGIVNFGSSIKTVWDGLPDVVKKYGLITAILGPKWAVAAAGIEVLIPALKDMATMAAMVHEGHISYSDFVTAGGAESRKKVIEKGLGNMNQGLTVPGFKGVNASANNFSFGYEPGETVGYVKPAPVRDANDIWRDRYSAQGYLPRGASGGWGSSSSSGSWGKALTPPSMILSTSAKKMVNRVDLSGAYSELGDGVLGGVAASSLRETLSRIYSGKDSLSNTERAGIMLGAGVANYSGSDAGLSGAAASSATNAKIAAAKDKWFSDKNVSMSTDYNDIESYEAQLPYMRAYSNELTAIVLLERSRTAALEGNSTLARALFKEHQAFAGKAAEAESALLGDTPSGLKFEDALEKEIAGIRAKTDAIGESSTTLKANMAIQQIASQMGWKLTEKQLEDLKRINIEYAIQADKLHDLRTAQASVRFEGELRSAQFNASSQGLVGKDAIWAQNAASRIGIQANADARRLENDPYAQEDADRLLTQADKMAGIQIESYENSRKAITGWKQAWGEFGESVTDGATQASDTFNSVVDGMSNNFKNFLMTGEWDMRKFTLGILADIATMSAKWLAFMMLRTAGRALGFASGGVPGTTSLPVAVASPSSPIVAAANGGVFHAGRSVTAFASGGIVTAPTLFGMSGGTGIMGEAGPEAIMPLKRGRNGKLGVQTEGSAQKTEVIYAPAYTIDARGADVGVEQRIQRAIAEASEKGYGMVLQDLRRNGPIRNSL